MMTDDPNSIDLLFGREHPSRSEREALRDILEAQTRACLNRAEMYLTWMAALAEEDKPAGVVGATPRGNQSSGAGCEVVPLRPASGGGQR